MERSSDSLPEPPDSAGLRVRLYSIAEGSLLLLCELEERARVPLKDDVESSVAAATARASAGAGADLILVVLQDNRVLDSWHLSPVAETPIALEEGLQEEEEEGAVMSGEDDDDFRGSVIKEGEDIKDDLQNHMYSLKLRIWYQKFRLHLLLFDKDCWLLTRQYKMSCLSDEEMKALKKDAKEEFIKHAYSSILRSDYEGALINSNVVYLFVQSKLNPTLYDFRKVKLLGKGAYSNVILGRSHYDHKLYAVKVMRLGSKILDEPREVKIHSYLQSPYIVTFSQAWIGSLCNIGYEENSETCSSGNGSTANEECWDESENQQGNCLCISMEFCPRTLGDYLDFGKHTCDVEKSYNIFHELISGVKYMHDTGIIHRDLKPANVFFGQDGKIRIGDFGHACFHPGGSKAFEGTPNRGSMFYSAPELSSGFNTSEKADIYSLGLVYLQLFSSFDTGYDLSKTFEAYRVDVDSQMKWEEGNIALFRRMTSEDPEERPSTSDLLDHFSR